MLSCCHQSTLLHVITQRACSQSIKNRVHAITILPLAKGWFSHRDIVCRGAEISKRKGNVNLDIGIKKH